MEAPQVRQITGHWLGLPSRVMCFCRIKFAMVPAFTMGGRFMGASPYRLSGDTIDKGAAGDELPVDGKPDNRQLVLFFRIRADHE
jgi:hypothetical protein